MSVSYRTRSSYTYSYVGITYVWRRPRPVHLRSNLSRARWLLSEGSLKILISMLTRKHAWRDVTWMDLTRRLFVSTRKRLKSVKSNRSVQHHGCLKNIEVENTSRYLCTSILRLHSDVTQASLLLFNAHSASWVLVEGAGHSVNRNLFTSYLLIYLPT